jgi:pyruvate/2-oxoglutarate dehydrogenase complex dihydrolipoamide acyltransferase (E2) component
LTERRTPSKLALLPAKRLRFERSHSGAYRGAKVMSHTTLGALVFAFAAFAVVNSAGAQQPSADPPREASSEQSQTQAEAQAAAKPAAPSETASTADHSTTSTAQKAAGNSSQLATITVNGGPSADILRSARDAGFKIKIADGTTHFCKTQAPIGTRFVSESCMNEQQVTLWLSRAQDQREKLQNMLGAPAKSQ